MGQVALHQFPWVNVKYEFKCRNDAIWTKEHIDMIRSNINGFCTLKFTRGELEYLSSIRFFKKSFVDFLNNHKIKINGTLNGEFRFVTYYSITREKIDYVIDTIREYLSKANL